MARFRIYDFFLVFAFVFAIFWGNYKYRIIAFHIGGDNDVYRFRVLTWNICSSEIATNEKQEDIALQILAQDADIIQLNEFCLDSCLMIDSILSKHYLYKNDVNAKALAGDILYSKRRLTESGIVHPDISNAIYSKMLVEKDSLYIIGCHLSGNNREGQIEIDNADSLRNAKTFLRYYRNAQKMRMGNTHLLKQTVLKSSLPIIIMGDMNDFNASAPMDSLKDAGMKNAWWRGGFGYGATYHEGWLRLRIDHIYYSDKLKLKGVKVVNTDLSDHNLLIADFSI